MSIDLSREAPIKFNEAAKLLLVLESRPSHSTWWRWWRHGVHGVRLETIVFGGRRYTTKEAVQRFITATTAASIGELPPTRTPARRQRNHDRARQELIDAGIADVKQRGHGA